MEIYLLSLRMPGSTHNNETSHTEIGSVPWFIGGNFEGCHDTKLRGVLPND